MAARAVDAAGLKALLAQFEVSERSEPEVVERAQLDRLREVLAHARATVPYYRRRGAYAEVARRGPLDAEAWRSLPVMDRAEVQAAGKALRSEKVPPSDRPLVEVTTSGSTGRPLKAVRTSTASLYWQAITVREQIWHQRDFSGTWASIKPDRGAGMPPEGLRNRSWGPFFEPLVESGPAVFMSVEYDVAHQVSWLREVNPHYLMTLPSNLTAIARQLQAGGSRLSRLKEVSTYGETLGPQVRDLCRDALGVEVVDLYSTQELGYLALQCPTGERYHVQSEAVFVEVLDENGLPCQPGEIGRVVVTSLRNSAMPFLRYEVGDYAEAGGQCPCGRGLPVLTRVMGRTRNMLTLPNGTRHWPTFGRAWQETEAIRQFQLVQHTVDHIEARIVGPRPLTPDEEARFTTSLGERLGHAFTVTFTYLDAIDRHRELKFEDFISLVEDPNAVGAAS